MFINHTHKFIFIHIPKNGGTSIRNSFDINGYDKRVVRKKYPHDGAMEIRDYCGDEVWNTFYKFAVIRNPYDRLVSYYHFHKSPQYRYPARAQELSFKEWVMTGLDDNIKRTQFNYLAMRPDYTIRFETLQDGFDEVCTNIGIESYELPHYNKSEHEPFESYYDDELKDIVYGMFLVDFQRWDYAR